MKIDMSKVYDRVEWHYLEWILTKMNFPNRRIEIIMRCVSTVRFQILINRKPSIAFKPTRGLRQSDPLFPYLFILCAEGFSSLIK